MKKVINILLILGIMFTLCACDSKSNYSNVTNTPTPKVTPTSEPGISEEKFISEIQGWWVTKLEDSDCCYFMNFDGETYIDGYYPGEFGPEGRIISKEKLDYNEFIVIVQFPEQTLFEEPIPEHKTTLTLTSANDFISSMVFIMGDKEYQFTYAGLTDEDMREACDRLLKTNESSANNEAVELVLERKIFNKNSSSQIYNEQISSSVTSRAYKNNWSFRQILNDSNYSGIRWNTKKINDGTIVTFYGKSRNSSAELEIQFYIPNSTRNPIAISVDSGDGIPVDAEFFGDSLDADSVKWVVDATAAIWAVVFSVDGL